MIATLFGQAWHAMGANKMRTFLTMLGMVIGVFAVVLMMATGFSARPTNHQPPVRPKNKTTPPTPANFRAVI